MTIHLFISQALVSAAMYTNIKAGGSPETQSITYPALLDQVSFLSQLFRGEFIFPTAGLVANLEETVGGLEQDGVVSISRWPEASGVSEGKEGGIRSIELSLAERENGRENFDFYCFLIWPFIEGAWLGAVSLLMLTPPANSSHESESPAWLDARAVQAKAQLLGKTLYAQGDLSYFEAVNKETLKNAYTRFEEEGIIITKKPPKDSRSGTSEMVRLSPEWTPRRGAGGALEAEGKLWEFCEEVSRTRLEGKNRRDGDAANGRVLGMIEEMGKVVWAQNVVHVGPGRSASSVGAGSLAVEDEMAKNEKRKRAPLRTRSSL